MNEESALEMFLLWQFFASAKDFVTENGQYLAQSHREFFNMVLANYDQLEESPEINLDESEKT